MTQPKITLLTCTHNGEKIIEQVLGSIANQTDIFKDCFEALVVGNASSDRIWKLSNLFTSAFAVTSYSSN